MARAERRYVLGPSDRGSVQEFLERWNDETSALCEGRVFVNRRRVLDPKTPLSVGDVLEVFGAKTSRPAIRIVERRGDLVVIDKPSGTPAEPDQRGLGDSAREQAEAVLGAHVHAASRLDLGVSGLMMLTLTARARRHLASQRQQGSLRRLYLALASNTPTPPEGRWADPVRHARRIQTAETAYRVVEPLDAGACLLAMEPLTGRLHQLRFHAAEAGAALFGDRRYGGPRRWCRANGEVIGVERVMLHAAHLQLLDAQGSFWEVASRPPADFSVHYRGLGGMGSLDQHAFG